MISRRSWIAPQRTSRSVAKGWANASKKLDARDCPHIKPSGSKGSTSWVTEDRHLREPTRRAGSEAMRKSRVVRISEPRNEKDIALFRKPEPQVATDEDPEFGMQQTASAPNPIRKRKGGGG